MIPDWQTLFAPRPLATRGVRLQLEGPVESVWFATVGSTDLAELPAEGFLTTAEMTRASVFRFGQPRENFTLGRLAAKLALATAVGASSPLTPALSPGGGEGGDVARRLRQFEIGNGERGEPVVSIDELQAPVTDGGGKLPALGVSLSHVNGRGVAVAFPSDHAVGLDLELVDPRRAETVREGVPLSAAEEDWLKTTALPEATALLLLWTARESLSKALGCGLACKWETLALQEIGTVSEGIYSGRFLHHPQFRCVNWVGPEAVMSLTFVAR